MFCGDAVVWVWPMSTVDGGVHDSKVGRPYVGRRWSSSYRVGWEWGVWVMTHIAFGLVLLRCIDAGQISEMIDTFLPLFGCGERHSEVFVGELFGYSLFEEKK